MTEVMTEVDLKATVLTVVDHQPDNADTSVEEADGLDMVDSLGVLRAAIADLVMEEAELCEQLKLSMLQANQQQRDGQLFSASFMIYPRDTVNADAVRQRYPQEQHPELYDSALVEQLRTNSR